MAKQRTSKREGITAISVQDFKSLGRESRIEIRPLTILAGANSSGKSSMMQPLLLMKQTLEASYDPGPLLLDGPNAKFTSVDQFLSHFQQHRQAFSVEIEHAKYTTLKMYPAQLQSLCVAISYILAVQAASARSRAG